MAGGSLNGKTQTQIHPHTNNPHLMLAIMSDTNSDDPVGPSIDDVEDLLAESRLNTRRRTTANKSATLSSTAALGIPDSEFESDSDDAVPAPARARDYFRTKQAQGESLLALFKEHRDNPLAKLAPGIQSVASTKKPVPKMRRVLGTYLGTISYNKANTECTERLQPSARADPCIQTDASVRNDRIQRVVQPNALANDASTALRDEHPAQDNTKIVIENTLKLQSTVIEEQKAALEKRQLDAHAYA
ncbi:hypothetical protein BDV96DRAFT_584883 [Lophiotrema nucula]|uniref:Uncharacterized protein n=1 Tax=Lophiotrema nucula TaxID=690887 RepID=A0A6A5YV63_9PLEO|nr:hypothetical protein BDV96DRAFT_584883 [Lophiotrema nucula]